MAELVSLLATLGCIDSNVYVEVNSETFESLPGLAQVIADNDSTTGFRSKRPHGDPSLPSSAGCGRLGAVPLTAQKRRLRVA